MSRSRIKQLKKLLIEGNKIIDELVIENKAMKDREKNSLKNKLKRIFS